MSEEALIENCETETDQDCTLHILVRLLNMPGVGGPSTWRYVPEYLQNGSNPTTENVIVNLEGDIDLTQIPKKNGFSKNVDITYELYPYYWVDGRRLPVKWEKKAEDAFKLTPKNQHMIPQRFSDTMLVLNDRAIDGKTYNYKLGVVIGDLAGVTETLDPKIKNDG